MTKNSVFFLIFITLFTVMLGISKLEQAQPLTLLNVSYDVIRDFYKQYNADFRQQYEAAHHNIIKISQSHGGASKQAISVANGLPADVVTLTQTNDIDLLVQKGLVNADWQQALPNQSVPFGTVMVLLVKNGNPKQIYDWADLVRDDVEVIFANPKTSANGRFVYLSALAYAQDFTSDADEFIQRFLANVPILESAARGATITFTQRGIGDVLIAPENEAALAQKALGDGSFEVVYPSYTAYAPVFVAEVNKNTQMNGTQAVAQDYLHGLWSQQAQLIAAEHHFRPTNPQIREQFSAFFPQIEQFDVNEKFGSWADINKQYFADGAKFDQLYIAAQQLNQRH